METCPSCATLRQQLAALRDRWLSNADMLDEGNKSEWPSEGAGMQRSNAKEVDALLAPQGAATTGTP